MADPVSLSLALGVAGAATSAGGTLFAGAASSNAAAYASQVAANNAIIARQNAVHAEQAGEAQAQATSLRSAATGGKIKSAQAASGVDVNAGSAVDVQASQRQQGKLDTETVMSNAELQAYGYRTQATNFEAESQLDKAKSGYAMTGAEIGAAGSVLSNASGLGFRWSDANPGTGIGLPTGSGDVFNWD
jgi:hypothetical protein